MQNMRKKQMLPMIKFWSCSTQIQQHLNTLTDNGVTTYQDGLLVTGVKATQLTILPKLILEHSNMTIFLIEKISELMMLL
ncbi:hypothetical protein TVAG_467940 [Trichomonas vaginalis G3]|uniref:Uncharacterized protein n=1 Tax=Trichomonas vaginalis (strain ATCC PRA-98 / G3) TaxID=412133 RepID=A2E0N4_TRIV3|nr:hypothetical protein TVAGG3_0238650 [Trichomonas vaginalis G3]XP_001315818.1 hypothetical protein TVAGG3_0650180 [Trichomonas vaginalis G3]XP_001315981.1 hypothetical protein TVAGG3_0372900 [Trichomonas vaginalis G3]XP_001326002.1 hypothetical protein TVAGG3_0073880 [Trichomonas vaginalis G3]XP_001330096.2 hypothetical protein TVAGG3_0128610 [Trichomonas vaginalis G3]XP_001330831.1 hypothetical protein TVAGG3_0136690 [Trichomonas vaginalis G3]XP_051082429.1 hypothetical protein TVAGG3_0792|eukprot:XP_001281999.1 hypothetical protein [Trichomonas vaginalis G3]